jgi:hypothetical protein
MAAPATTPAATAPDLPAPMSESELRSTAASQIDLEIGQSVAPLQSQIGITQGREDRALGQIGGMFDALQPVVQQGATAVQNSYDQATAQEKSVFANAQAELAAHRGNRAADAQSMAQLTGGPVAIGDYTQPFDDAATDLTQLGAGQQLHTLAYAQAGEQQAQQFAGQVFPLVRTEQMASARNTFEDQIKSYQDQITALESQKGAQVNKRYNELRTQELQYGLQRAQYQLDKLDKQRTYNLQVKDAKVQKAEADRTYKLNKQQADEVTKKDNRDYQLAVAGGKRDDLKEEHAYALGQRTAKSEEDRVKIARDTYDLQTKQLVFEMDKSTGTVNGKKTLEALQTDAQIKQAAATLGLSKKDLAEKIREFSVNAAQSKQKLQVDQSTAWVDLLDNAVNPQPGKTYSQTEKHEISSINALRDTSGEVYTETGADGKLHYYKNVTVTQTVKGMQKITDPTKLVDYLVTAMHSKDFSKERAIELVQNRFPDLDNWKYGDEWPPKSVKRAIAAHGGGAHVGTTDDPFALPDWVNAPSSGTAPYLKPGQQSGPLIGDTYDAKNDPIDHYEGSIIVTKSGAQVVRGKYTKLGS